MLAPTSYSARALRDLRGIPEPALLGLIHNPDYASALLNSSTILPDGVFSALWAKLRKYQPDARRLVERPLNSTQRALVLETEKRTAVFYALFTYNLLSHDEALQMKLKHGAQLLSNEIISRYKDDDVVMQHLLGSLEPDVKLQRAMRSSVAVISDEDLLSFIAEEFTRPSSHYAPPYEHMLYRFCDLVELRPHLIIRLLDATPSTALRIAVAGSRHVSDVSLLAHLLLGAKIPAATSKKLASAIALPGTILPEQQALLALVLNPVTHPSTIAALLKRVPSLEQAQFGHAVPFVATSAFDEVANPTQLQTVVDSACVTSHSGLDRRRSRRHQWDLLVVAKNPHLDAKQARSLYLCLVQADVRQRLGEPRCVQARNLLLRHFLPTEDAVRAFPPAQPLASPRVRSDSRPSVKNPFVPGVSVAMAIGGPSGTRDATALFPILGEDPQAWEFFISMLDTADPQAGVLSVAQTAARLAANPHNHSR